MESPVGRQGRLIGKGEAIAARRALMLRISGAGELSTGRLPPTRSQRSAPWLLTLNRWLLPTNTRSVLRWKSPCLGGRASVPNAGTEKSRAEARSRAMPGPSSATHVSSCNAPAAVAAWSLPSAWYKGCGE